MRLNGEISEDIDDDDDKEEREEPEAEALMKACSIGTDESVFEALMKAEALTQNLVVGYALTSKKKQSFLQPKLLSLARYIVIIVFVILLFKFKLFQFFFTRGWIKIGLTDFQFCFSV